jgi:hypothetical protein
LIDFLRQFQCYIADLVLLCESEVVNARMVRIEYIVSVADMEEEAIPILDMEEEAIPISDMEDEAVQISNMEEEAHGGNSEEERSEDNVSEEHLAPILRHLFLHGYIEDREGTSLIQFPPLIGPFIDMDQHPEITNPQYMDLDVVCFMMFILDLLKLFGIMVCPMNQKVKIKDFEDFDD